MNPESILNAAGTEAQNLGGVLYVVFDRGSEPIPPNLKVIPELEFDSKIHNFYSMVHPHEVRPKSDRREVGIMAINKKTNRARSGTKGGAQGHLYKTLPLAKAAVSARGKPEDYDFYMAFIESPIEVTFNDILT